MLPLIYGTGWSFGKIQALLAEAGERAAKLMAGVDLSGVRHVALDEMFSQGKPVFAGIDLDTQYLFQLAVHPSRSGEQWSEALGELRDGQGLSPWSVTKDAGSGLAWGTLDCWPGVQVYDDLFHATYMMGREAYHLERRAYSVIGSVEKLMAKRGKAKTEKLRRSLGQKIRRMREREGIVIERYDRFEALRSEAERVLALADRGSGRLRRSSEVEEVLTRVADEMMKLGTTRIRKVARYISNRAKGLGNHLDELGRRIEAALEPAGGKLAVEAVVRAYQASLDHSEGGPLWDRRARAQELEVATKRLVESVDRDPGELLRAVSSVLPILAHRYRASSAIECLNSVLRPYLAVQKSVSKPFLDPVPLLLEHQDQAVGPLQGHQRT